MGREARETLSVALPDLIIEYRMSCVVASETTHGTAASGSAAAQEDPRV
ncbi:MAG: hypothetical protein JWP56_2903, partial [Aeromicrobium sp.]|nr:hypothetical protein [Aeromicrobium sp.]